MRVGRDIIRRVTADEGRSHWLQVALVLAAYVAFSRFAMKLTRLPMASYEEPWLGLELARHAAGHWWALVAVGLLAALLIWRRMSLLQRWTDLSHGSAVRLLVATAAFALAWAYATQEYNYFHQQWHWLDRALLVAFWAALCFRPIFVLPFLATYCPMPWQLEITQLWLSWIPMDLPLNLLFLFAGFFVLALAFRWSDTRAFLLLSLCIFGSEYWFSGLEKLKFGWPLYDEIHAMLPSSYAAGWLRFLGPETVGRITQTLSHLDFAMRWMTIFLECVAPLLLLAGRRTALAVVFAWIAMHVGIFGTSGILFWQWMLCLLCLAFLLFARGWYEAALPAADRRRAIVVGALLVLSAPLWLRGGGLGWIDTHVRYVHRLEGAGASGTIYALPPRFFQPFEHSFVIHQGNYLSTDPVLRLVRRWNSWDLAGRMNEVGTQEALLALEREFGIDRFSPERRDWLVAFLQRFVANVNADREARGRFGWLGAPPLLWTSGPATSYAGEEPLVRVDVTQELWFFDGRAVRRVERPEPRLEVPIPGSG